jgi:signal transduction histidine kinase
VIFLANGLIGYGYFWSLRSVRMVKDYWQFFRADVGVMVLYFLGLALVIALNNTYPARVALISSYIAVISATAFMTTSRRTSRISLLGDAALMIFAFGNASFALLRGGSALLDRPETFLNFVFWDQVFFIWSITAVFCFAIGLFLNGTAMISDETLQALEKERSLTDALTEALEGQRNLQKLILHELKRPLNTVATAVDRSRKGKAGMSVDEVECIYQLTGIANDYLRGIGEYEDIHALFCSPTLTDIKVASLVDDIRNKWQVNVDLQADADGCALPVDLLLFDIAIGNLIDNARKFGRTLNAVRIKVGAEDGTVIFDVTDDGPGIPDTEAQKVFRQFYKTDGNQTNSIEGCGLGLYVARRIAEAHGGSAHVLSQRPSTLRLAFPLNSSSGDTDA